MKELVERLLRYISIDTQSQHGSQTIHAHIDHDRRTALGLVVIRTAQTVRAQDTAVILQRHGIGDNAIQDHSSKQDGKQNDKGLILTGKPDQTGFNGYAKGFQDGYDHGRNNSTGKSYVVKRITLVRKMHMGT